MDRETCQLKYYFRCNISFIVGHIEPQVYLDLIGFDPLMKIDIYSILLQNVIFLISLDLCIGSNSYHLKHLMIFLMPELKKDLAVL